MECYLFDTNIWSGWYKKDTAIIRRVERLAKSDRIILSSVVWGEAVYGAKSQSEEDAFDFLKYSKLIKSKSSPVICEINEHTAEIYGELRAELFDKYAPKNKLRKGLRPEQLKDPISSKELGIQENDLWLVAQAIADNYTLVTRDRKMDRIIKLISPETLRCENW